MHVFGAQPDPGGLPRRQRLEMTALAPGDDLRVRLEQHGQLGVLVQRRLEHAGETAGVGGAMGDGGVPEGLVHHQHVGGVRG